MHILFSKKYKIANNSLVIASKYTYIYFYFITNVFFNKFETPGIDCLKFAKKNKI